MIEDIDHYIQSCEICQRTGLGRNIKQRPPLHPIPVKGAWNQVGIDLVGPLQETPRGNRYLITMTDYFSKWSEAAPIKNKQADTVAAFIYSVFQRFGIPNYIITDQGREFNNELMTSLCAMTKCTHKITSAYHPQSNGLVERFNQTIISGLQKVTNEHSDDWDTKIDDFLFAYRITIQDSTKYSPFEVMFNRQPNLPLDIGMSSSDADAEPNPASPNPASVSADSVEEIFSKMQNISKVVQGNVRQNIQAAQSRQKKHYDKQHVSQTFAEGSKVWKANSRKATRKGDKLSNRRTGPYIVHAYLGKGLYKLRREDSDKVMLQKVNGCHLTPFHKRQEFRTNGQKKSTDVESSDELRKKEGTTAHKWEGIPNVGNTCFINVTAQVLTQCNVFSAYRTQSDHVVPNLDLLMPLKGAQRSDVQQMISDLKASLPKYQLNVQHDAVELMRDILSSACVTCGTDCSFLKRYCHIGGRNIIICRNCGYQRDGGDISYPIVPLDCGKSVQEQWDRFFDETELDCDTLCDKCGIHAEFATLPDIMTAPETVWVAMNRWNASDVSNGQWHEANLSKNTIPMEIDQTLHIQLSGGKVQEYSLSSLVLHHGHKLGGGHFTCQLLGQDTWYNIDDASAQKTEVNLSSPAICLAGYIKGESFEVNNSTEGTSPSSIDMTWKKQLPEVFIHLDKVISGEVESEWLKDLVDGKKGRTIQGLERVPEYEMVEDELFAEIRKAYVIPHELNIAAPYKCPEIRLRLPFEIESSLKMWNISHSRYAVCVLQPEALEFLIQLIDWKK